MYQETLKLAYQPIFSIKFVLNIVNICLNYNYNLIKSFTFC